MKIGPVKHPPLAGVCSKFRRMLQVGGGGCHPSMRVCCQSFELLPFQRSSNKSSTTAIGFSKFFAFVTTKIVFYRVSAGRLPTPASPLMQMIRPKINLGDSQTDQSRRPQVPEICCKEKCQNFEEPTGLVEIQSKKIGKCPGSKTDSKHVCLDDTSPTSSLRRNLLSKIRPRGLSASASEKSKTASKTSQAS